MDDFAQSRPPDDLLGEEMVAVPVAQPPPQAPKGPKGYNANGHINNTGGRGNVRGGRDGYQNRRHDNNNHEPYNNTHLPKRRQKMTTPSPYLPEAAKPVQEGKGKPASTSAKDVFDERPEGHRLHENPQTKEGMTSWSLTQSMNNSIGKGVVLSSKNDGDMGEAAGVSDEGNNGAGIVPLGLAPKAQTSAPVDRTLSGGIKKPKLTEEELVAKMAAAKLKNQQLLEKRRKIEEDESNFQLQEENRRQEEQKKREDERRKKTESEKNRKELDTEREKNRQRKMDAMSRREWDVEKNEEDYNFRGPYDPRYRRGAHGGVSETIGSGSRHTNRDSSEQTQGNEHSAVDGQDTTLNTGMHSRSAMLNGPIEHAYRNNDHFNSRDGRHRGRGRGRGARGRGGRGRGGYAGDGNIGELHPKNEQQDTKPNAVPIDTSAQEWPSLPPTNSTEAGDGSGNKASVQGVWGNGSPANNTTIGENKSPGNNPEDSWADEVSKASKSPEGCKG